MSKKIDLRRVVSARMKEIREALDYTQDRMALLFDLTRSAYTKYENGAAFPRTLFLDKLGNDCNISLDWFICGKGEMFYKEAQTDDENEKDREAAAVEKEEEPKELSKEHKELIEQMEKNPLLHHEVMAYYYRYRNANKEMFEESPKIPEQAFGDKKPLL